MFKLREHRAEYKTYIIPVIIAVLRGGIKEGIQEVKKILNQDDLSEKIIGEIQKTILMNGESYTENIVRTCSNQFFVDLFIFIFDKSGLEGMSWRMNMQDWCRTLSLICKRQQHQENLI